MNAVSRGVKKGIFVGNTGKLTKNEKVLIENGSHLLKSFSFFFSDFEVG